MEAWQMYGLFWTPVELQWIPRRSVAINSETKKDRENVLVIKESPAHCQALCLLIRPYSTAAKYVKVTSHQAMTCY